MVHDKINETLIVTNLLCICTSSTSLALVVLVGWSHANYTFVHAVTPSYTQKCACILWSMGLHDYIKLGTCAHSNYNAAVSSESQFFSSIAIVKNTFVTINTKGLHVSIIRLFNNNCMHMHVILVLLYNCMHRSTYVHVDCIILQTLYCIIDVSNQLILERTQPLTLTAIIGNQIEQIGTIRISDAVTTIKSTLDVTTSKPTLDVTTSKPTLDVTTSKPTLDVTTSGSTLAVPNTTNLQFLYYLIPILVVAIISVGTLICILVVIAVLHCRKGQQRNHINKEEVLELKQSDSYGTTREIRITSGELKEEWPIQNSIKVLPPELHISSDRLQMYEKVVGQGIINFMFVYILVLFA